MSPPFQKIAVAGATGNTGPTLIKVLLAEGFEVTALTRSTATPKSIRDTDAGVRVIEVDYLSHDSLVSALQGIDAVIVCGVSMLPEQTNLITAAIAAGVNRFFPAGFAGNIADPLHRALQTNASKVATEVHLQAHEAEISRTLIHTGPLFDFCVRVGVLIDMKGRAQTRYDDGEKRFPTTTVDTACRAVAAALKLGDRSQNRAFHVHDFVTSQKALLELGRELTPGDEWSVTGVSLADLEARAEELLRKDPEDRGAMMMQRPISVFGKRYSAELGEEDNLELGIGVMDEGQIRELLRSLM